MQEKKEIEIPVKEPPSLELISNPNPQRRVLNMGCKKCDMIDDKNFKLGLF